MKRLAHLRWIATVGLTGLLLALAACGGSSGSSNLVGGTPLPPPALTITTTSLPDGDLDQPYSFTLQASGGTAPRTWSITTGDLPDGLDLDPGTGVISGLPTVDATFNFTVQVADSGSPQQVATRALSIFVSGLRITTTSLPGGQVGVAYSQFVSATNGQPLFSWSISVPALPTGLSIDTNTGEIGGLPTTAGTFPFTVQVTDDLNDTATADLTIDIDPPVPPTITTTALPDGVMDVPYQVKLHAAGGQPPLAWSIVSGSGNLPSGLTLGTTTGEISGTPAAAVMESFTVQVTDSTSPTMQTASQPLVLTINSALAGRNDDTGSATALPGNITARASISPYTDPEGDPSSSSDVDVYEITASAGSIVEIRICARSLTDPRCTLTAPSPLDSVIEIVNVSDVRFQTCNDVGDDVPPPPVAPDPTPGAFDDACINDDITLGVVQDSKLEFQVPTGTTVFYVRVLDFRGDARPDLLYDIIISGAN